MGMDRVVLAASIIGIQKASMTEMVRGVYTATMVGMKDRRICCRYYRH
jgi:hypothetical protein